MEWENWLDKKVLDHGKQRKTDDFADPDKSLLLDTEPDKTIPQIKRDFDDETHEDPYSNKNDVNKILGAIGGAIAGAGRAVGQAAASGVKGLAAGAAGAGDSPTGDTVGQMTSTVLNAADNLVEDVKNENQTGVSKAWESWLDKNNGIERDHKKENKHEWDGKFSSSTIRDDAENDDDKAVSEEESLEELTDGKLEEVEKLKSWEVFLKGGFGGVENQVGESYASEEEANRKPDMQKRNPKKRIKGKNVGAAKKKLVGIRADGSKIHEIVPNEVKINPSPTDHSDKTGAFQETAGTKNMTGGDHKAVAERVVAKNPEYAKFMSDVAPKEALGTTTNERVPTAEEYDAKFNERVQPEKNTTRKRVSSAALAARRASMKSWEAWLEKTTKEPNVGTRNGIPHPAARTAKEIEASAQQAASTGDVDIGTLTPDMKKKKSWEEWVEKMQGAGDARYGNQHLTGMEQHPVADDESMELSAETEENNEKQEKKEDKGDKDNKPYKALSQE